MFSLNIWLERVYHKEKYELQFSKQLYYLHMKIETLHFKKILVFVPLLLSHKKEKLPLRSFWVKLRYE